MAVQRVLIQKSRIASLTKIYSTLLRRYSKNVANVKTRLRHLLGKIVDEYQGVELMPFHVESCTFGRSFSDAQVHVYPYVVDREGFIKNPDFIHGIDEWHKEEITGYRLDLKPLFAEGMREVTKILNSNNSDEKKTNISINASVESLRNFLVNKEFHEQCLWDLCEDPTEFSELQITALLANHLFAPLVSHDSDRRCHVIIEDFDQESCVCPCADRCTTFVKNIGFGSEYLFYGRPDVMLYPIGGGYCPIFRSDAAKLNEKDSEVLEPDIAYRNNEINNYYQPELRTEKNIQKIVSQAVTFSFLQRKIQQMKRHSEQFPVITSLIPTIFVSAFELEIYLYDSVNDILLRNCAAPIPIFEKSPLGGLTSKLNLSSVLLLWMMIHHLTLKPLLSDNQIIKLRETCGIKSRLQSLDLTEKVENSLIMTLSSFKPLKQKIYFTSKISY